MPSSPEIPHDATSANVAAFLAYLRRERRLSANSITAYRYAVMSYLHHGGDPGHATRESVLAYLDARKGPPASRRVPCSRRPSLCGITTASCCSRASP